ISQEIKKNQEIIQQKLIEKEKVLHSVTRFEVMIEMSQNNSNLPSQKENISFNKNDFEIFVRDMNVFVDQILKADSLQSVKFIASRAQESLHLIQKNTKYSVDSKQQDSSLDIKKISQEIENLKNKLE